MGLFGKSKKNDKITYDFSKNPYTNEDDKLAWEAGFAIGKELINHLDDSSKVVFVEAGSYYNVSKVKKPISNLALLLSYQIDDYVNSLPAVIRKTIIQPIIREGRQDILSNGIGDGMEYQIEVVRGEKMAVKEP